LVPVVHWLWAQLEGGAVTQVLLLQVWPAAQVPHESVPPQPLATLPQFLPRLAQVLGVQAVEHRLPHIDLASLTQVASHELLQQ